MKTIERDRKKGGRVLVIIGEGLMLLGLLLLVIKGMSAEYIDVAGILHENFFLLPIGFLCIFSGGISLIIAGIRKFINKVDRS